LRRKQEIASKWGRGYRKKRPYRLMLDSSSPIKLGERASVFKAAFSMAHRNMIADIALTSAGALAQTLKRMLAAGPIVRGPSQTLLPRVFWTSGRLTKKSHDAKNGNSAFAVPGPLLPGHILL
jgi:hypothetical protein